MAISTYKKTKTVRTSDYIFTSVPIFTQTILSITGTAGRVHAIKISSTNSWTFILEIDGVVQTSSVDFNNAVAEQWIAPDLDRFISTPSVSGISFANSFEIRVSTPANATLQLHAHVEYDTEVSA